MNYLGIKGGNDMEAMRALTGMPSEKIYVDASTSIEKIWSMVTEADKANKIMTGDCMKEFGNLVTSHVYSLIGAVELKKDGKTVKRLIKMRNPWGRERYNGPWNDEDSQWTDDFKKQAGLSVDLNDGVFHIPLEDYTKAYENIGIVHYQNWVRSQLDLGDVTKGKSQILVNPKQQDFAVSVDGYTTRMSPESC